MSHRPCLLAFVAILVFVSAAQTAQSEPSCMSVVVKLASCLPFLKGSSDSPSTICCVGAHSLNGVVSTGKDKQAVCKCIKKVLANVSDLELSKINRIPKLCDVDRALPMISNNTQCSEFSTPGY